MRSAPLALALLAATAGAAPRIDVERLEARYRAARLQRNLGWGLSAVGIALLSGGVVALGLAARDDSTALTYEEKAGQAVAGISSMVVGLAFSISGIVLSVRGQDAMTDVRWRLGASIAVAPAPGGAAATIRVVF